MTLKLTFFICIGGKYQTSTTMAHEVIIISRYVTMEYLHQYCLSVHLSRGQIRGFITLFVMLLIG